MTKDQTEKVQVPFTPQYQDKFISAAVFDTSFFMHTYPYVHTHYFEKVIDQQLWQMLVRLFKRLGVHPDYKTGNLASNGV